MNAALIGSIVGAVIFGYLWSRLWLWLTKKGGMADPQRVFAAYAIAWVTAIVLGAFGYADGGPPDPSRALII